MNVVGLDLGIRNFKAIEIKKEKGMAELVRYGISETIPANLLSETKEELEKYSKELLLFFNESGFSTPNVIVALPETSVFTRIITVPKMSEKELKSAMMFEAEQYIPLPLKEVNFDFQILNDDTVDKGNMSVLLVAAAKTLINKYIKILKDAKLTPVGLEPETLSLARIVGDKIDQPNPSIIVSIDSNVTNIIVTYKGIVRFTRSISTGGDALTRAVAQGLGFDFTQAEEYKKTYGLDSSQVDGKVFSAIKPVFDIILNEIRRAYYFYTTHNTDVNIRRVVVCGGTALMPGLLFYLTTNLNLEVELANPWQKITIPGKFIKERQNLMERGPFFVTSIGLALKED
ncbi:hypothetical protein A2716_01470 [candidate division WWE3 bacterium RIFCSPHIGHO2_01_FULL_40_23]|uniref:SHS2 domain-containing protein n=1 Tax=candidate division WWE3 bacterium RIFCSPLOWO2_01_FULL_41_18 TaxID=1802625 RepID=A0A1F4VE05_UNCKA|nr:MAG: hypothetical protein A2716_01470 [candidate division WWE3 bacterium RIFCSPHIGHO2_01_FULL_40_23]OGC55399.1 MAG: hypothetical protein A3A78_00375 [candidate division WWE3 bacterium RIFCSPLOWO2_01_FULL_41_18]